MNLNPFFSSKRAIRRILPELNQLEIEMQKVLVLDNKIKAIVRFFQIVSPLQDAGGFIKTIRVFEKHARGHEKTLKALKDLQSQLQKSGRCQYGMNRTELGQEVTEDNVFLGNVYGLWTETAHYWLSHEQKLKDNVRDDISLRGQYPVSDWYIINNYQCGEFVDYNAENILKQIAILKAV
jgi:hypothetical protein